MLYDTNVKLPVVCPEIRSCWGNDRRLPSTRPLKSVSRPSTGRGERCETVHFSDRGVEGVKNFPSGDC